MCFGVRDAIAKVLRAGAREPLTVLGELVHNGTVLEQPAARGIRLRHEVAEVDTPSVAITAHGASERRRTAVRERGLRVLDANRLECATFHILTPYPGTPLFRQLDAEGRLLHRNWDLYDTAHAVFRPKHLTPEELELGYDWLYRRLFSHASIWGRRPATVSEWPSYFGGAYFYKRSNRLWRLLIRNGLVRAAWRPLVARAQRRGRRHR
jgi:hypothetical protein